MSCNCSCPANLSSVATESILIRSLFDPFIIWHELILFQGEGGPSLMTTLLYIFTVYVLKEVSLVKGSGHYTRSSAAFFQIIITHECIQSILLESCKDWTKNDTSTAREIVAPPSSLSRFWRSHIPRRAACQRELLRALTSIQAEISTPM